MAITPDDILRPGRGLDPAGATPPANLARLLDKLGANVDPDRAAKVQATINRVTAKAKLSPTSAQSYEKRLRAMAGYVADSDLLGPNAWDGHTLPIPWEVVAVYLAEKRTDQTITRRTADTTVCAVAWVNTNGRLPDQLPSEAQDTTGWPTVDSVPVVAELLAGWDVDLPRWQCRATVVTKRRQRCRADTPNGRCQHNTPRESGLCGWHEQADQPPVHPFMDTTRYRRCANSTVRPDQLCPTHATWQMCRALSTAGDRCGGATANASGLCCQHPDAAVEFDPEPGPTDPTPIPVDPTRKAPPVRAHHIEALAWTDPAHRHRSELIHAAVLLAGAGVPISELRRVGRDAFRFDECGQVTFDVRRDDIAGPHVEPLMCIAALRSYHDDTGQQPECRAYDAWREGRQAPSAATIIHRFGKWSEAVTAAFSDPDPLPDPFAPQTITLVGGHADRRQDPVAALRAVLNNPACAAEPFLAFENQSAFEATVRNAIREQTDPHWRWRIETRDSAMILAGWWWGIRAAELVSLRLDQFEADPDLEVLWLRYDPKTNKTNRNDRVARRCTCDAEIIQPVETEVVEGTDGGGWFRHTTTVERRRRAQRPGLCPIRALCEWLACDEWLPPPTACGTDALIWLQTFLNSLGAAGQTRPAFPTIGGPGVSLGPRVVGAVLRGRLDRCDDLDWAQAHGLRRGQATEMRAAGVDWDDIMADLGWKTEIIARGYVDQLDDPDRVSPGMTALRAVLTDDDTDDVA